jgi:hypothetical protein
MTLSILDQAAAITPELATYIVNVAEAPLRFDGLEPNRHSSYNHVHLWKIESLADTHPSITTSFRIATVGYIFGRWQARLRTYHPYQQNGYRLYLYEDTAPTISVVAETKHGFPYAGQPFFVESLKDVLELYSQRSWRSNWQSVEITPERIITTIEKANGSISTTVAHQLELNGAALRRWIEWFEIAEQVNTIRKRYGRRPAQFVQAETLPHHYRIWEKRLPARYED